MKRIISLVALVAAIAPVAGAQVLNVRVGNVTYAFPAAQTGDMPFAESTQLTVMGRTFTLADVAEMYVDNSVVTDNTVAVTYNGATASVRVAGNIARYVEPTVDGANVTITQSADVADTTCGEITYSLTGASTDGAFYLSGSYKSTLRLDGLTLTSTKGAPIDVQIGKRIAVIVADDTENTLTDCSDGTQKGCIVVKGHPEFKGFGTLNVYGNTSHAIYAKEYIELKNATVNVLSAVKDGLNCNQYFRMDSGALTISGTGDDGIQVSYKDDVDRKAEDTGSITIADGTINVDVTATAAKGIKADGCVTITGGDITVKTSGGGLWDDTKQKTKAATCISADENVLIEAGKLNLTSTGSGGKGISCDSLLTINGGDITVLTSGGMYAYVNGTEYPDYTGNTDYLDSDQKSSPKGIKADRDIVINGGTINVTTKGNGGEGIESKATLTINDGTITVNAYDDGLNSSSHMYLNGGTVTVIATNNDGIDSNGNMYIAGGTIMAFGASSPECGIDANEEEGYSVIFTGGNLLSVGGGNSVPSRSESTQPYVQGSGSVTAGSVITLKSGNTELVSFTVPENYSSGQTGGGWGGGWGGPGGGWGGGSSILISCGGLTSGSSYTLVNNTSSSNVTAVQSGGNSGWRP